MKTNNGSTVDLKSTKTPKTVELQVDVIAKGTEGLGGLYFTGEDGRKYVVFVSKNAVTVGQVSNPQREEIAAVASVSYKLRETSTLKVAAEDDTFSVHLNGTRILSHKWELPDNATVGLYLQRKATRELPGKLTLLDNFRFVELEQ